MGDGDPSQGDNVLYSARDIYIYSPPPTPQSYHAIPYTITLASIDSLFYTQTWCDHIPSSSASTAPLAPPRPTQNYPTRTFMSDSQPPAAPCRYTITLPGRPPVFSAPRRRISSLSNSQTIA